MEAEGITAEDVAIDAIVPLFYKGKNNFVISEKIIGWQPKIENEDAALFFLEKIISKRVEQYISSLLRQSDPFFSRILNSVNYLIRTQSLLKKYHLGKIVIVENDEAISAEVIDNENFKSLPGTLFLDKRNIFKNLFIYLKSETEYYPAIPCNDLVMKLKHLNFSGFKKNDASFYKIEEIELDEIIKLGLNNTLEKLEQTYLDTNKLNKKECALFKKALTDMAEDLKNGGVNPGLYKYLKEYQPYLKQEDYNNNYHNILEYLLKTLKTNIADELEVN